MLSSFASVSPLRLDGIRTFRANSAASEPKRDPRIDSVLNDLGKVRSIYQTALSPDGKMIAWVVAGEEGGKRSGSEIEVAPGRRTGQA